MERISPGFINDFTYELQPWKKASLNHTKFRNGDVAFAKISPCFENRKSFIADGLPNGIGGGTTELIVLRQPLMCKEYTFLVVSDERFIKECSASYKGIVGQQRIKTNIVKNYYVPVPPVEEQRRIVESVKKVFQEIDIIDEAQNRYSDDLKTLKSKIIDAGIHGQLTEQQPEDGNADDLYTGEVKCIDEEIPFEIPKNWKWVRLGDVVTIFGGKRIPAGRSLTSENTGHKYIRVSEMKNRTVVTDGLLFVPEDIYPSISKYIINKKDVYITVAGTIGRVGKIPEEIDGANLTENADRLVFKYIHQDWLINCLDSRIVQRQIEMLTTQVAQPKLAIKRIQSFLIPLPPLPEQQRIAARIDTILLAMKE